MKEILYVFIGGGIGSILRYGISRWMSGITEAFFLGTLTVNFIGSFLIAVIYMLLQHKDISQLNYTLLAIGFCGGFTTFSSFSMENVQLIQQGQWLQFILYVCTSLLLGIAGFALGLWLMKST